MNRDWIILGIAVFLLLTVLIRLLYVEEECENIVNKHIGDSIPRTTTVNIAGNYLSGECSYKIISQTIEVT